MGYNGKYYDPFVPHSGSNKITYMQRYINKKSIFEVKELIEYIQAQFAKDMKDVSNVHLGVDYYDKLKKEKIEYVVEEAQNAENGNEQNEDDNIISLEERKKLEEYRNKIISLNRQNRENIERNAAGDER